MSDAALTYVRGCTHPAVKDGTRDLFEAIAHFVPEGETTTPFIGMPALAHQARRSLRTVVTRLANLVAAGEVRVLDGGLGKIARYQIVHLEGAQPMVAAPLPLRADLRPVARRARPRPPLPEDTTGDLFADPPAPYDQTAKNLCKRCIGWVAQPVQTLHRLAVNLCNSITGWRSDGEQPVQIDHRLGVSGRSDGEQPVQIDHRLAAAHIDRARDVRSSSRSEVVEDARAREPATDFLAWFERTYPTVHHGAVCTVRPSRDGPLVRELLQRPGIDVAHLQAMATLLWSITTDGVVKSDRWWIAEQVTVRDLVVLHRKADFLDLAVRRATHAPAPATPELDAEDLAAYATLFREAIEARLTRRDLETWIKPLVVIPTETGVVLGAPSEIHATYVRKNFGEALEAATQHAFSCAAEVIVRAPARREQSQ